MSRVMGADGHAVGRGAFHGADDLGPPQFGPASGQLGDGVVEQPGGHVGQGER